MLNRGGAHRLAYVARCKCHIARSTAVRWHFFFNVVNVRSDVLTAMVMEIIVLQPVASMSHTARHTDRTPQKTHAATILH
jgi:hypothetical protein